MDFKEQVGQESKNRTLKNPNLLLIALLLLSCAMSNCQFSKPKNIDSSNKEASFNWKEQTVEGVFNVIVDSVNEKMVIPMNISTDVFNRNFYIKNFPSAIS